MIRKVDLVMWTKNGAKTLPLVLRRISQVMPREIVRNRVIVDDGSIDDTRKIAESFGWKVVPNQGQGISDGANTALRLVTCRYFVSLEQDLLLAYDWWERISRCFSHPSVAVASGIRLLSQPLSLRRLEEFVIERYLSEAREKELFHLGKTLDNTAYKTEVIRKLGGFPRLPTSGGVDTFLAFRLESYGYKWKVDYRARSTHLRPSGLREELGHRYYYGACSRKLERRAFRTVIPGDLIMHLLLSPIRGLEISLKKRTPQIMYIYPLMRFSILKGYLLSEKILEKKN